MVVLEAFEEGGVGGEGGGGWEGAAGGGFEV